MQGLCQGTRTLLRSRAPNFGITVYPAPSAGRTKRLGSTSFLPCIQCGSYNDTRTTAWSNQGDGLNRDSGDATVSEDSGSGCWFCHSLKWRAGKPQKYPDDRFAPNPDLKRRRR